MTANPDTGGMTAEEFSALYDTVVETLKDGGTFAQMKGVTDDECEALYSLGYGMYEEGRYTDALKVLSYLVTLNHTEHRYLMALGATAQALGKHEDALKQYMAATLLDPLEPAPVYQSAHCLMEMGQYGAAVESCDLAIGMCQADTHSILLERAKALRLIASERLATENNK